MMGDETLKRFFKEYHQHEKKDYCDIDEWSMKDERPCNWGKNMRRANLTQCGYTTSRYGYYSGKLYKKPKSKKMYQKEYHGSQRAYVRRSSQEIRKLSTEEILDYDFQTYQHKHSALWDCC
jgi:hypothetical protein